MASDETWQTERANEAAKWWTSLLQAGDRAAFEAHLRTAIETDLRVHGRSMLQVDYDPFGHILDAVRAAGVECSGMLFSARGILPGKTRMTVKRERIEARSGYGSPWEVIAGEPRPVEVESPA